MAGNGGQVVEIAREWLGTPYLHQASKKGAGADCLGLVRGVWRELYGREPEQPPAYSRDWSEPSGDEVLWRAAARHLTAKPPRTEERIGDVLLFRVRSGSVAKHLGILSVTGAGARFVHAYCGHGVIESPLGAAWRRRIVARFEFPKEYG